MMLCHFLSLQQSTTLRRMARLVVNITVRRDTGGDVAYQTPKISGPQSGVLYSVGLLFVKACLFVCFFQRKSV